MHGELLAAALKVQSAKGSHNPKLNSRLKYPLHGTCVCWAKLCKVPYICSSCETWMSKQIFSSPIALYVPHKRRRKNSTSHFKQPGIFRQSSFLFKVQLEIYSCVPLQRLFYDISVKSQGVISASELHSIFSTQQSNQTKYLNGDYCNISQSCWKQKHGSKIANSSISF